MQAAFAPLPFILYTQRYTQSYRLCMYARVVVLSPFQVDFFIFYVYVYFLFRLSPFQVDFFDCISA
jgi:hypothetical protein